MKNKSKKLLSAAAASLVAVLSAATVFASACGPDHEHEWDTEWLYDETNHWHACLVCDEVNDLAAHTFDKGECTVCGYEDPDYQPETTTFSIEGGDTAALISAISQAQPGDTIELAAGTYEFASTLRVADVATSSGAKTANNGTYDAYITVTALPDPEEGVLKLGGIDVSLEQVIPRGSMQYLRFVAAQDSSGGSFSFRGSSDGWTATDVVCTVNFLDRINFAPVTAPIELETVSGVSATASLVGEDPEDDSVTFQIVEYPEHGTLSMSGSKVVYTPAEGYTGRDSFSYTATDVYGNVSRTAETTIMVDRNKVGFVYADMNGNPAHAAAVVRLLG